MFSADPLWQNLMQFQNVISCLVSTVACLLSCTPHLEQIEVLPLNQEEGALSPNLKSHNFIKDWDTCCRDWD